MLDRLKKLVKKIIGKVMPRLKEDKFYTDLFTKHAGWSTPEPNHEEVLRWKIIESFILDVKTQLSKTDGYNYKILDLGCGRGWLSNLLSDYGDVIGIEPVKAVVEYGRQLFPNLDLRHGVAEDLIREKKRDFFDIVVCSEVIEHIPDKKKTTLLKEIKTLLKSNGFLIITTPRKDVQPEWNKYADPNQPIEDWLTEREMEVLLEQASFRVRKLERFSIPPCPNAPEIPIYQLWLVQNT